MGMYCPASFSLHEVAEYAMNVGVIRPDGRLPFVVCNLDIGSREHWLVGFSIFPGDMEHKASLREQLALLVDMGTELANRAKELYSELGDAEDEQ